MRLLLLPSNICSQISYAIRAFEAIDNSDIQARGVAWSTLYDSNASVEPLQQPSRRRPVNWVVATLSNLRRVLPAIRWADVVHWHTSPALPFGLDVRYAFRLRKKLVVEFHGSEIRDVAAESKENPYFARALEELNWNVRRMERRSRRLQMLFATRHAQVIVPYEPLMPYVNTDLFATATLIRHLICLSDFRPEYPDLQKRRPLIVHSPSNKAIKGTTAVLRAIESLQGSFDFDFRLIHGLPHEEAVRLMRECDVYLDQFVLGAFGVAALEAMALGKAVVCYIKPSMVCQYPGDLPIVNASQDSLPQTLTQLIAAPQLRRDLGRAGRSYVEKYHDAHLIAHQLADYYRSL